MSDSQELSTAPPRSVMDRSTDAGGRQDATDGDAEPMRWPATGDRTMDERSIKMVIGSVCAQHLDGKTWTDLDPRSTCVGISRDIVDACRCVREDRSYKTIVQTVVYENDSASSAKCTIGARCLWDANTDRLVHDNYVNEHVVCNSQVYFSYDH